VVSTYSHASGPMLGNGFGFATEADKDSYTVDNQYYLCTELHLLQADPTWGPKSGGGNGAKYGATGTGSGPGTAKNLRTPDGGKTWLVDVITLPAMNPQGTQTPVPAYDCSSTGTGGSAGRGGSTRSGGSVGKGGSEGGGGTIGGGGSLASDGSAGKGGNMGTGGSVGSDASTSSGSGGVVRLDGEASQGSGGTLAVGSGGTSGATSSGGATGANATAGSANAAAGTSGCGCAVGAPSPSPHGGWSVFLLLGALALRASRRRNRR